MAPPRKRPEGERWAEFVADYQGGMPTVEMAAKYDAEVQTIRYWASTADPPVRRQAKHAEVQAEPKERLTYAEALEVLKSAASAFRKTQADWLNRIAIATKEPIILVPTADWHTGDPGVDYEQFDTDVATWESTPGLYLFGAAEGVNNPIKPNRGEHENVGIDVAWDFYAATVRRLRSHLLCLASGNHDGWTEDLAGVDMVREIARANDLLYTGTAGLIDLTVGSVTYRIFRAHITRFNSIFNATHGLKQTRRVYGQDWDIGIGEHTHCGALEVVDGGGKEIVVIKCGTYKVLDGYARKYGFYGARVRNPAVVLWPDNRKMAAFWDYREAIAHRDAALQMV